MHTSPIWPWPRNETGGSHVDLVHTGFVVVWFWFLEFFGKDWNKSTVPLLSSFSKGLDLYHVRRAWSIAFFRVKHGG